MKKAYKQDEIIAAIRRYIFDHDLKSGDSLPSQMQLTKTLKVSRTALREAISALEAINLIETVDGKGIFVKDASSSIVISILDLEDAQKHLKEILELRMALEREVLKMVVERASDDELSEVEAILNQVLEKYSRAEDQSDLDRQFHFKIYSICHNRVMSGLSQHLQDLFERLWNTPDVFKLQFTNSIPAHKDMFLALKARNAKKAVSINDHMLKKMISSLD